MTRLERVADTQNDTGEGPLWHPDEGCLFWVDIPAGELYRFDPDAETHTLAYETDGDQPIGGFTIQTDGSLLLFGNGRVSRWQPGSESATLVTDVDADTRFNDVIADPEGRVFCGTMPGEDSLGDLYRLDVDATVTTVVEDVDIANGMGFTADLETFYFTESEARRIYAFDYDRETGGLSNRRTFVETPAADGIPDGLTVDGDDYVWSARWNGGRAVRYDPTGDPVDRLTVPARKVSSVTFAGPEYDDLYLTTALEGGDREAEGDGAGALFRATGLETGGSEAFRSRIKTE
ncbi:SMP-30/Gluconolaconase/LRE domain protein [Haloterrigena salina JCM 13891]|uniref:SMP-30/Gluconolaconase/LRE domain protein n=1 Tax=Haloterrigena salina JCM 13891 TaxID=1227488 RepID=M0BWP5_9EURY|nr:SMP-30/gluconolactonase/LRE family protein [Haloterrigena salina]ELZ15446.1 SMP-30/Gluconolaconase/LRE domain protein [Haloterrigena salina JCM 13891]